jgi:hypothetical protein
MTPTTQPVAGPPFYWCLEHQRVEPALGCANDIRMGPYETVELAQTALARARA